MNRAHKPLRAKNADGKQGKARRRMPARNLREMWAETGVAAEVDIAVRRFDQPTAPKRAIAIPRCAAGEMLRRGAMDAKSRSEFERLPPIEFIRLIESELLQAPAYAERA